MALDLWNASLSEFSESFIKYIKFFVTSHILEGTELFYFYCLGIQNICLLSSKLKAPVLGHFSVKLMQVVFIYNFFFSRFYFVLVSIECKLKLNLLNPRLGYSGFLKLHESL